MFVKDLLALLTKAPYDAVVVLDVNAENVLSDRAVMHVDGVRDEVDETGGMVFIQAGEEI